MGAAGTLLLQRESAGKETATRAPAPAQLCPGAGEVSSQGNTGANGSISDFKKSYFFFGCLVRKFPQPCRGSLIPGAYYITNICSANERHLKVLAKQSWESWGTDSHSAPATEIRASRRTTPTEAGIKQPERLPPYRWLAVPGRRTPLPPRRRGSFVCRCVCCSVSLASGGETLSTCRNIDFIDSNPGVSQLQPALEALPGGLLGGLFQ